MLVGPLDATGLIDGDDGVLHAVDHGFELAAALGGIHEDALDVAGGEGDGVREAVEVAVLVLEGADGAVGDGGGGGLEEGDVLADRARRGGRR